MVAETLTATRAASTFPVFKAVGAGLMCAAYGTYEIGAAVEDGDIFAMCKIPAGAVIVGGWFLGDDIDTGTEALDMDLGWADNGADGADPDGLGNFGVLTGDTFAAGNLAFAAAGLAYPIMPVNLPAFTKETTIQVEANVASNGGHTGTITVIVYYVTP